VAVLSRGYGRREPHSVRVVSRGEGPIAPAALAGDEPYLIAARTRGAWVAVAPRRFDAGEAVLREAPVDLFLLDDGFSHHALARDFDIVTVDARRWFGDGRLVPAGILREPLSRLREADMLVVTKAERIDEVFEQVVQGILPGLVGWSTYLADHLAAPEGDAELPLDALGRRKVFLFSGIADPLSFEKTAAPLCGEVVGRHRFPDHHPISGSEMAHLDKSARDKGAEVLLTTEKDFARLPAAPRTSLPLCALVMGVSFLRGDKQLRGKLLALAEKPRG
jgi:tetraacyldisaccharide 4'-kinase